VTALQGELLGLIRRDRTRRTRRQKFGKFLKALLTWLLPIVSNALFGGWFFMLGVGVVHAEWLPQVPTLGYWWAVLIGYLLRCGLTRTPQSTSKKKDGDK
jgi:hypothetical protein